jgi:hypothetical protein
MKKFLIPVDFPGNTDLVASYTLELSRDEETEICLLHTFFDQFMVADNSFPDSINMSTMYNEELLKEIMREAEKNLDQAAGVFTEKIDAANRKNVRITKKLTSGDLLQELRIICDEFLPDMVIFDLAEGDEKVMFREKVSTHFINHTSVPVLAIPAAKKFGGFRNIMFATDLIPGNAQAIKTVNEIFKPFGSNLHCVHFLLKKKEKDEREKMEELKSSLGEDLAGKISFDIVPAGADIQTSVDNYIKENNISLVAFQPHKKNLFYGIFNRTVTKKNLFATHVPLLAVPVLKG